MCCTFNKAEMYLTVLGLFIADLKHVIFYQAEIKPEDRTKYTGFLGALPKKVGSKVEAIDAEKHPEFLNNLAEEALPIEKGELRSPATMAYSIQMIETKNYVFFIAENAYDIPVQVDWLYDERSVPTEQREYVQKRPSKLSRPPMETGCHSSLRYVNRSLMNP